MLVNLMVNNHVLKIGCKDVKSAAKLVANKYELNDCNISFIDVLADFTIRKKFIVDRKGKETRVYKIEEY